jgi:hypothetical protein
MHNKERKKEWAEMQMAGKALAQGVLEVISDYCLILPKYL